MGLVGRLRSHSRRVQVLQHFRHELPDIGEDQGVPDTSGGYAGCYLFAEGHLPMQSAIPVAGSMSVTMVLY